ncbi:signal peptidase I [Xylanimonas allomyrinae]|uniref:Signal peptidase I n=1 Tax=Xylanimonas allomyrinae TaxID=2509459 RepID=A0A4P6EPB2_9MICO|nr:signal peptidase I [Xylanimonas allomyrinae]QAY64604.1 signal peptidase I [Xylanimonas allomyrinae]
MLRRRDVAWRIVGAAVTFAVSIALVAVVVLLSVIPRVTGGASLTVLTGSMEPTFSPGDVIVVRGVSEDDVCTDVGIGDIVTYFPRPEDPALVTHRVVGVTVGAFDDGTSCRLVTQGDDNTAADDPVSPAQVRGRFLYRFPRVGLARQWALQNTDVVLAALAAWVVVALVWSGLRPSRTRVVVQTQTAHDADLLRESGLAARERRVALREAELGIARPGGRSGGRPAEHVLPERP